MTIYIDVVLLENLIMNYIILYATAIISKTKTKIIRLIIASGIGAVYSVVAYTSVLEIYSTFILKILLSIIITYVAFNPQSVKNMCKQLLLFYLTSFAFGGAAICLIYFIKPQDILMKNGLFVGTYPLKTIFLGAIVGFIAIVLAFKIIRTKISKNSLYCNIEIEINNNKISTTAMIDTGNLLKDPITNTPVIVVERTLLYDMLPKEILNNLENILGGDMKNIPEEIRQKYMSKLKVIPFSSLGKQNGMLLGIKADQVKIKTEEEESLKDNIIIGIYDKSLTKKGEYRALVGINLL